MGLKGVKKECQTRWPSAFKKGLPSIIPEANEKTDDCKAIYVKDFMPDIYKWAGNGVCMTPLQLATLIITGINELFQHNRNAEVYILRADISKFMPKEKAETQQNRLASAETTTFQEHKWDPVSRMYKPSGATPLFCTYPEGCKLTRDGIVHKDGKTMEPVYVRRLMMTRYLRVQFYELLEDVVEEYTKWCSNVCLIFEWRMDDAEEFSRPSLFIQENRGTPGARHTWSYIEDWVEEKKRVAVRQEYRNRLGEADLAVVWWMKKMAESWPNSRLLLHTKDTDTIPLMVSHFWNHTKPITWVFGKEEYMDVSEFIRKLKADRVTPEVFVATCVLSGTDFFEKYLATDQIGHPMLWSTAIAASQLKFEPVDTLVGFGELVRFIRGRAKKWPVTETKPPTYKWLENVHKGKSMYANSDSQQSTVFVKFVWNYHYWWTLHAKNTKLESTALGQTFFADVIAKHQSQSVALRATRAVNKAAKASAAIEKDWKEPIRMARKGPVSKLAKTIIADAVGIWKKPKGTDAERGTEVCNHIKTALHQHHVYERNHPNMSKLNRMIREFPHTANEAWIREFVQSLPIRDPDEKSATAASVGSLGATEFFNFEDDDEKAHPPVEDDFHSQNDARYRTGSSTELVDADGNDEIDRAAAAADDDWADEF